MPYMYEGSSDEEVKLLLDRDSNTRRLFERPRPTKFKTETITELFRLQASRYPSRPAVQFEDQPTLSYRELDQLSNKLASILLGYETNVVAVCLDRSAELIISILAILKAGRAYVVLDRYGSHERNRIIIENAGVKVVLSDTTHQHKFDSAVDVVSLLKDLSKDASPAVSPEVSVSPTDLAYIIYTSGSIGRPKGVLISHKAAATGISYFSLNNCDRWLLFYNPVFSAAQRTMLATLCKGGCVCLASQDRLVADLPTLLSDMKIEALGITPSMLATLSPESTPSSLKQITTVGEPLGDLDVSAWITKLVDFRVSYGLSECAQLNMSRKLRIGDRSSVVGNPSDSTTALIVQPNTNIELLDDSVGELCLQGSQLADGYLGLPEETSKRFVESPDGTGRMFRTGDLARRISRGAIEILGRVDRQMKINGQRLDPEEVATILRQHKEVVEATIVDAKIKEEHSLVAAVSFVGTIEWTSLVEELRALASTQLPSYMVPRFWLRYDTLAKNANGKLDWKKIRQDAESANVGTLLARGEAKMAPWEAVSDEHELLIRDVWASILGLDPESIGRHHSFLSLGGSSMAAIQMINKLRKEGVEISLESFFSQEDIATIGSQSQVAMSATSSQTSSNLPAFSLIEDAELKQTLQEQPITNAYPATDFQESVFASTMGGSAHYTYQRKWKIDHCDAHRLQLAFHVQFLRSTTLRTSFISTEHGLIQVIKSDMEFPWQNLDEDVDGYLQRDLQAGFQLDAPLWRAAILQNSVLVVTMHHALFDFWSHRFLYDDVSALYKGLPSRRRPDFHHFVNHVQRTDPSQAKAFWAQHLAGGPSTTLNLSSTSTAITSHSLVLHTSLDKLAASAGVTSGTLIQFAWAVCLSKHTRSNDVIFAITFSGRDLPVDDIDALDGPSVTVVPRRIRFSAVDTVKGTLQAIHKESWQLLKHSQFGLRKALKAGACSPDDFDTMINILPAKSQQPHSHTDVFQEFGDRPQWKTEHTVLQAQLEGNRAEFGVTSQMESERSKFVLDSFVHVLQQIQAKLEQPVNSIEVMTSQELAVLHKPVDFANDLPETMLTEFYESVEAKPDGVALQWQNLRSITYSELDERSNQMANLLRFYKVKKGDRVCLYLDKSPLMIMIILGCLKAGTVYVPLSPENPLDRNAFIATDTEAVLTLTEAGMEGAIGISKNVLALAEDDLDVFSSRRPKIGLTKEDSSYIIYTSGSTGTPKGCLLTHGAAAAAIHSMIEFEQRHARNDFRALQFSNYVFDASILDIFNTLNSAGTLCMAPTDRLLSDLAGVINEMQVYHSFFTPTVLRLLDPVIVPSLKSLTVGGESVNAEVVQTWTGPDRRFVQAYGPTETAIACTMKVMSYDSSAKNLGTPFGTTNCFVLDRETDELAPYGSIGELCIAGPQVGAGYWKRPEITEKVFRVLETPDGPLRYYRSGDLARWLPGGEIEYHGRKDHQVKIHGYRIELGEIERALISVDNVKDCVTMVANVDDKVQLASFVVFATGEKEGIQPPDQFVEDAKTLYARTDSLAHYMVPKYLLPLYNFPRTAGGKADRKKLQGWFKALTSKQVATYCFETFGENPSTDQVYEPPQNAQERLLVDGFSQLLKLPSELRVGRASNFLSLGGDSISAINLTSYVRKHGYELSVSTILRYPILHHMSAQMRAAIAAQQGGESLAVAAWTIPPSFDAESALRNAGREWNDVEYSYACPPGQTEFLERGSQKGQGWVLMTARKFEHDVERWMAAVKKLTDLNDILRTTFVRYASSPTPRWMGIVLKHDRTLPKLDIVHNITAENRDAAIDSIWNTSFVFGEPFIRYAVLVHADGTRELVTKMDHALYDGTLLRVWADQFLAIQHDLPPPEVTPFSSFAAHIYQTDKSPARDYWRHNLRPEPFDFPRITPDRRHKPLNARVRVDRTVTASTFDLAPSSTLESIASQATVTVPILFQAAFQLWLFSASSSTSSSSSPPFDITFDYLYTGRNVALPNPQSINGTCATFVPLRSFLSASSDSPDPLSTTSLTTYLTNTQTHFWAATEHASIGLSEIYGRPDGRNRVLFLFQPFESPIVKSSSSSSSSSQKAADNKEKEEEMRFVYMAGAQTRMPQPYAIVCEIKKVAAGARPDGAEGGFKVQFTFDPDVVSETEAERGVTEVVDLFGRVVHGLESGRRRSGESKVGRMISVADILLKTQSN